MQIKQVLTATALAISALAASAATSALDLSSGSAGFISTPPAGGFSDTFTFTLASAATLTGIVTSAVNGGQDVDFSSIFLSGPSGLYTFSSILGDPYEVWTISTPTLSAGSYSLTVIGLNSPAIGTYSGNLAVSVSVVPEPETYALMLAGLGVMGFVATRRRAQS